MSFRRYRAIARKEFLHVLRDPRSLLAALAVPLLFLLLFGYALTLDVDRIPTYIYDQDHTPQSRQLVERFRGSRYFSVLGYVDSYDAIVRDIDRNRILLSVVIPHDFARGIEAGQQANLQLQFDGSDSNTASIAQGYAEALTAAYALELRTAAQNSKGAPRIVMPVEARIRIWYNEDLKSKNYIVPGLTAVILMIISSMLTSLTIAREWENGTMEQLLSTPVRPIELVLGKLSAFFVLGLADLLIALFVGVVIFGVPMRGNILLLFFTSCLFLFGGLCWGIFISAVARSQLLAYQLGMLTSFLPAFLLSGFVFSIENMPKVIQAVTYLVPARYFVSILKGIFLKGAGVRILWPEILLLAVYATVLFTVATRKMRQKLG